MDLVLGSCLQSAFSWCEFGCERMLQAGSAWIFAAYGCRRQERGGSIDCELQQVTEAGYPDSLCCIQETDVMGQIRVGKEDTGEMVVPRNCCCCGDAWD